MISLGKSKFIDGIQHHLYEILEDDDWSEFPWAIPHEENQYWLPVKHMQKVNKGQAMDDYSKCKSCSEQDHEGIFCRCESRNMRIAKERRNRKESPWQPERLNPEDHIADAGKMVCDSLNSENK